MLTTDKQVSAVKQAEPKESPFLPLLQTSVLLRMIIITVIIFGVGVAIGCGMAVKMAGDTGVGMLR